MKMKSFIFLFCLQLAAVSCCWAVRTDCTKYVSTTGSAAWGSCTSTSTTCSLLSATQNATAGERVCIMAGTYDLATINPVNGGLSVAHSGSGSGATAGPGWYNSCPSCIVFEDYDNRPVTNLDVLINFPLSSTQGHVSVISAQGSNVSEAASWVIFKGLAVDGRSYASVGFNFQWNHHVAVIGNSSRNTISAGIGFQHGDYESAIGNVVYNSGDNPHNITTYATSCSQGITHNLNHSFDNYTGIHNVIFQNIVASSYCHTSTHSDGRGYDYDNTDDAAGKWTLVGSNIFYGNGSAGESTNVNNPPATFAVCCVIFVHNTNYWNTLDLTLTVLKSDVDDRQSSDIYHIDEINVASTVNSNTNYNYSQSGVVTNPVYAKVAWQNGQSHNFTPLDPAQFLHLSAGFQNPPIYNASAGLQWRPCTLYAAPCTPDPKTVLANGQFKLSSNSPYIGAGTDPITVLTTHSAPAQVITDAANYVYTDIAGATITSPPSLGAYQAAASVINQSYNVYRSTVNGGCATVSASGCSKIGTGITQSAYTDSSVVSGKIYFYVVTRVTSTGESNPSNQAAATIP